MDNKILVYLLIAFIAYNMFLKESFAITPAAGETIVTDKAQLDPTKYYTYATLNSNFNNTKTAAQNGGTDNCSTNITVPRTIYKLYVPTSSDNAVCKTINDVSLTDYSSFSATPYQKTSSSLP